MKANHNVNHLLKLMCLVVVLYLVPWNSYGQDVQVLLTVAEEDISKSEFLKVYHKNSKRDQVIDQRSLEEYIELYINFKLKVAEAKELGLDTTQAFKTELNGYRQQLAQPYLKDKEVNEQLLKEAYERKLQDIRASHILIKVPFDAEPKDTLLAYRKISKLRTRILKGEKFDDVARLVSEDPSAKDNGGDLGYFTVFQMIYPFETAAYNTVVGKISKPVRTRYGYHIILVDDKHEALGEIKVAHIMVITRKDINAEEGKKKKVKIDNAYNQLKEGKGFGEVAALFSEDKKTARNGGKLPWFTTGKMVGGFERVAAGLKSVGEYSKPLKTEYGWHIIQLKERKPIPEFDQIKGEIKARIAKDSRSNKPAEVFVGKLKKEYSFKEYLKERNDFYRVLDESFYTGKWTADKAGSLKSTMFTLADKKFTQEDFARYLQARPTRNRKTAIKTIVNDLYKRFVRESCIAYEDSKLESKYPDFKSLVQEYNDGILLFELTDQKVWSKAIKDTTGLGIFHNNNKTNYMWDNRVDAAIYTCDNNTTAAKVRKIVKKRAKKGYSKEDVLKMVNTEKKVLSIEEGKFSKGDNDLIDKITWQPGFSDNQTVDSSIVFVFVNKILQPMPKSLIEAKGLVTADYQTYLEKEWIELLRKKYTVKVNKDVLSTIK